MLILFYTLDIIPKIKAVSEERWAMRTKVLLPIEKLQIMQQNLVNSESEVGLCKEVYSMFISGSFFHAAPNMFLMTV